MATGYLAAGNCWDTANEAIDAYYSIQQLQIYPATAIHFYRPLKDGAIWKMSDQLVSGAISYTYTLPTNVYGSCTITTDTLDGLTPANALVLCTAFAVVLVTGFIFRAVAQALNINFGRNDDE